MLNIEFSSKADTDLSSIACYTSDNFGEIQALKYARELHKGIESVRLFPKIGKERSDLQPNIISFPVRHHVIYYRIYKDYIRIERILNMNQDPLHQFADG